MTTLLDYSESKCADTIADSDWRSVVLARLGYRDTCAFCFAKLITAFAPEKPWTLHEQYSASELEDLWVKACPHCGWWQMEMTWIHHGRSRWVTLRSGTLRTFDIANQEAPLDALRKYVSQHPARLRDIHPTSLEKLVAAVFRDFRCVDVIHTGRSHDGGIDLLVVMGDVIMPIQVKRRASPVASESVRTVRELFGVMFRDGYRNAAVVSTAERFSRSAKREVDQVMASGRCERFELVDFGRFRELLMLTANRLVPPWRRELVRDDSIISAILADKAYQHYLEATRCPVINAAGEVLF